MQPAAVQGSFPVWMQNLWKLHVLPQSVFATQGAPPASPQMPELQCPLRQSVSDAHAVHTCPVQRWLAQVSSYRHGSPSASLHSPARHTPLKQSESWLHEAPKCPIMFAVAHTCPVSQVCTISQWFTRSSTPLGMSVHVPS